MSSCSILALTPIELSPSNIIETNAEIESNIGVWNSGATYSKGQPAIHGASVWASKEDANQGNAPYTAVGTELALHSSVRQYVYVRWWHSYLTFAVGELVNASIYVGAPAGADGQQYMSLTGGVNKPLPDGQIDNADWEWVGATTSYFYTRTDIENGGDAGEQFWDNVQSKGFVLITALAADPLNYFPLIDSETQSQITEASKWTYVRDVNPHLIFDSSPSTQTQRLENLLYKLQIDQPFSDIVCLNAEGTEIQVIIRDALDNIVHDETQELRRKHSSPYTLLYNYQDREPDFYMRDLPIAFSSSVEININAEAGALAKVGGIYIGTAFSIGNAQYTPRVGTYVFKATQTNDFIEDSLKRVVTRTVKFAEFPVIAEQKQHDEMVRRLDGITDAGGAGRPSIFMGIRDDYVSFSLLGYLERHSQALGANKTTNNIKIEGVK